NHEAARSRDRNVDSEPFCDLIAESAVMKRVVSAIDQLARSDLTVVIEGETGTGKELVARALHDRSARVQGPFVIVDCGAIAPALLSDELFGHRRGAFSNADLDRMGLLESASGGTLFLDEIGELPPDCQPILLRAIEGKSVRRIGAEHDIRF